MLTEEQYDFEAVQLITVKLRLAAPILTPSSISLPALAGGGSSLLLSAEGTAWPDCFRQCQPQGKCLNLMRVWSRCSADFKDSGNQTSENTTSAQIKKPHAGAPEAWGPHHELRPLGSAHLLSSAAPLSEGLPSSAAARRATVT